MTPIGQVAPAATAVLPSTPRLRVRFEGTEYTAEPIAKGGAYEIFADDPQPGFLPNPRPGARKPYRRFVPACDTEVVDGEVPARADPPLCAPLSRDISWADLQRMSQSPRATTSPLLSGIRSTGVISRGTRMVKVLSGRQLAGHLHGWLPQGFCYRECDIAHLRTPAELSVLRSDGEDAGAADVAFALRWRAVDPLDYEIPYIELYDGLVRMPPRDRLGPPVLGTGFAPSGNHLIPEFVTANLCDLPFPAFAELLAYTADGSEVMLYSYLPEQRTWTRLFGPQWRHLFAAVPGVPPEQEYFAIPPAPSRLVGRYRGDEYEAIADPPVEFRVHAKTRSARYAVETLARRTPYGVWRGAACTITRAEGPWLRLRLVRPDGDAVTRLRASCVERGIYEVWAPAVEVAEQPPIEVHYALPNSPAHIAG
ncbi:MAG TPA: hypothetical protein VJT31_10350 [Rugosimonospora sp.]|nr:hypothetical protein [Rugosimonospora sp.]